MIRKLALAWALLQTCAAQAAVDRIEIIARRPFADGMSFDAAGPYEWVDARVWYAIDPKLPANRIVADIAYAPTDARGLVRFSGDLVLLRPVDPAKANGTFLYEVSNRGKTSGMQLFFNETPNGDAPGNGFLFRRGMTLVWSGWAADIEADAQAVRADLPIATRNGAPITGRVAYEFLVAKPAEEAAFTGLHDTAYPLADAAAGDAVLTERNGRDAARRTIDRTRWSFAGPVDRTREGRIRLAGGFQPGTIYELVYTARDPHVVGLGLAAMRDLLSYLHDEPIAGAPRAGTVLGFGISQSARLLDMLLATGFAVDEKGRAVFEGALAHVGGAGKGSFNHRFAMTSRFASLLEDRHHPTEWFPLAPATSVDAPTGQAGSLLDATRMALQASGGTEPKMMWVNTPAEYWHRGASLLHTDSSGRFDLPEIATARIYALLGAQHYPGRDRTRGIFSNCTNPEQYQPVLRALLVALEAWARDGKEPPASLHPRIADGTLVAQDAYERAFPHLPGVTLPTERVGPPRLEPGPRWAAERIIDEVPPRQVGSFAALVPAPDADGNDRGGIRPADVAVPLASRPGWNTRRPAAGFPSTSSRFDGSFLPFARDEAARRANHDPRPSLAARFADRAAYETAVRAAARNDVERGYLLAADVDEVVARAGRLYDRVRAHDPADLSCAYLFDAP